jgi:hypothetical protein
MKTALRRLSNSQRGAIFLFFACIAGSIELAFVSDILLGGARTSGVTPRHLLLFVLPRLLPVLSSPVVLLLLLFRAGVAATAFMAMGISTKKRLLLL